MAERPAHLPIPPTAAALAIGEPAGAGFRAVVELTKPRITRLVTITAGVGFTLSALGRPWSTSELALAGIGCVIGTALSSSGANALNQWMERGRDAAMPRTCQRPLPTARLTPQAALLAGVLLCLAGVAVLLALCGPAAASVSLATILIYLLAYTPLKPVTPLNTLVGAIPGALPPLIGWASIPVPPGASTFATLTEPGGWSLFLLMLVWQIPHFLAIAWMYRDDYAKGGYRMLSLLDADGRATSTTVLVWAVAFIPVSIAPAMLMHGRLSPVYVGIALVSGAAFLAVCVKLYRERTRARARAVFLASIVHLPVLLLAMVVDALIRAVV